MPESIRFCGLVVELHMHTNVYVVYARGCYHGGMIFSIGPKELRGYADTSLSLRYYTCF